MVLIQANAKINLTLDVLGKRDDGYHEVAMVMQSVGLFDTIRLEESESGIDLQMDTTLLPLGEKNLAWQAARLFLTNQGIQSGVKIYIEKRIPVAAGLAGGSTDAAAVLRGLNALFGTDLALSELSALGAQLGSDVPFCIFGGTMLAAGRGELLQAMPDCPAAWLVLAKPALEISTVWAYGAFDDAERPRLDKTGVMSEAIASGSLEAVAANLSNALEPVVLAAHPIIGAYKRILADNGGLGSLMSGSGPTVYSLLYTKSEAERAADALRAVHEEAEVFVVPIVGKN